MTSLINLSPPYSFNTARIQCQFRQPAFRSRLRRRLYGNLRSWVLRRPQGKARSAYYVCIFRPQMAAWLVNLPSTSFCIGGQDLRWYRIIDLTSRSRCWVHHLDRFQDPCIIVFRRVPCRVVSLTCSPRGRQLTGPPVAYTQPFVSTRYPPFSSQAPDRWSRCSQYSVSCLGSS